MCDEIALIMMSEEILSQLDARPIADCTACQLMLRIFAILLQQQLVHDRQTRYLQIVQLYCG